MEHISKILFRKYEKLYLIKQKEKILDFARTLKSSWDITDEKFRETYFNLFMIQKWK